MQTATHQIVTLTSSEQYDLEKLFAEDVLSGLSQHNKAIPCKYLYDDKGSELFDEICTLPEYYLTRAEAEILDSHKHALINEFPRAPFNLIELGAGDGHKTRILLGEIKRRKIDCKYIPIDISNGALNTLLGALESEMPRIPTLGLVSEYFDGLAHLGRNAEQNVVLFLGSNIGNFDAPQAHQFLTDLHQALNPGDLVLIGFDVRKDTHLLLDAYNDSRGITRDFNLNLLSRINRELGGNFEFSQFSFYSTYDPVDGAIKSYIISLQEQSVQIQSLQRDFHFGAFEAIHTESSFKFTPRQISQLAARHRFAEVDFMTDSNSYFANVLWRVI